MAVLYIAILSYTMLIFADNLVNWKVLFNYICTLIFVTDKIVFKRVGSNVSLNTIIESRIFLKIIYIYIFLWISRVGSDFYFNNENS